MFLYERLTERPSIAFVKRVFFNNYRAYVDFFANLDSTAKSMGSVWPKIFGDFSAQSYFTGNRSRPDLFIRDAPLLPQWPAGIDSVDRGYSIKKNVPPTGMAIFVPPLKDFPINGGRLSFIGDSAGSAKPFWNVQCILHASARSGHAQDSIFSIAVSASGTGVATVSDWSRFDGAVIVASNAAEEQNRGAALVLEPCPVTLRAGDSVTYRGSPAAPLSGHSSVSVTVKARGEAACSVSIKSGSAGAAQLAKASRKGLVPIGVFYSIGFPSTWAAVTDMHLAITEETLSVVPFENEQGITSSAFAIYLWDADSGQWTKAGGVEAAEGLYRWRRPIATPGLYGVFGQGMAPDSVRDYKILAFPNPVRRRGEIKFCADGKALMELLMYSVSGNLVYRRGTAQPVDTLKWSLVNTSGKPVAPGMYYALVGYKDAQTKGLARKKQKVLILP
jgi:hypothetical protein